VFAVPKGDMTYLGTTDTFYPDSDYWPRIDAADANYLLAAAAQRFSTEPLTFADIVSAWSGLRPLVAEEGKSASDISRKDEIWTGPGGVLSIAGGKLTAYRMMAERVVDMAEQALGRKPQASHTATTPLPGGDVEVASLTAELTRQLNSPIAAERLVGLYGAEASGLAGVDLRSRGLAEKPDGALHHNLRVCQRGDVDCKVIRVLVRERCIRPIRKGNAT
jgi:glycerol-3-phosphate dehydrogenase